MQAAKKDAQANVDSLKLNGGKNPAKVDEKTKKGVKKADSDGSVKDKSKEASKVSDDSADDKSKDSDDADDKSKDVKRAKKIYQTKVNKASSKSVDQEE